MFSASLTCAFTLRITPISIRMNTVAKLLSFSPQLGYPYTQTVIRSCNGFLNLSTVDFFSPIINMMSYPKHAAEYPYHASLFT